jgi:hypothetical protein
VAIARHGSENSIPVAVLRRAAFAVFEKMTSPEQRRALADELRASHEVIEANIERFRKEALELPRLRAIRAATLGRFSDEAIGDWDAINALITWLRWQ